MKELNCNVQIFETSFLTFFQKCIFPIHILGKSPLSSRYFANFKDKPLFHTLRILFKGTPFILCISTKNFTNILLNAVRNCFIGVKRLLTIIPTSRISGTWFFPLLFTNDRQGKQNNILFNISYVIFQCILYYTYNENTKFCRVIVRLINNKFKFIHVHSNLI